MLTIQVFEKKSCERKLNLFVLELVEGETEQKLTETNEMPASNATNNGSEIDGKPTSDEEIKSILN